MTEARRRGWSSTRKVDGRGRRWIGGGMRNERGLRHPFVRGRESVARVSVQRRVRHCHCRARCPIVLRRVFVYISPSGMPISASPRYVCKQKQTDKYSVATSPTRHPFVLGRKGNKTINNGHCTHTRKTEKSYYTVVKLTKRRDERAAVQMQITCYRAKSERRHE